MNKSLKYALIGAAAAAGITAFSAFGAESIHTLIANGQRAVAQMDQATAKHAQLERQNKALSATMASIKQSQSQLKQTVQQHNQQVQQLKTAMAQYKKNCQDNKSLSSSQRKLCESQQKQVNAQIKQVNSETESLQTRQEAVQQKVNDYNAESQKLNQEAPANTKALNNAFADEQEWLDKARNTIASSAYDPYRKKAGCPNVVNPPTTAKGMHRMSKELLSCLRNLAHSAPKHTKSASAASRGK